MVRGTTPTILFCSKQIKKDEVTDAEFTFSQRGRMVLNKEMNEEDPLFVIVDGGISVTLSQIETLMFDARTPLLVQLKVKAGDLVMATPPSTMVDWNYFCSYYSRWKYS